MCLEKVTDRNPRPKGIGYKWFDEDFYPSGVRQGLRSPYLDYWIPLKNFRDWQVDPQQGDLPCALTTDTYPKETYPSGFHIWLDKQRALMEAFIYGGVVFEVEYDEAQVEGIQTDCPVVVAKKFKLVKELHESPEDTYK